MQSRVKATITNPLWGAESERTEASFKCLFRVHESTHMGRKDWSSRSTQSEAVNTHATHGGSGWKLLASLQLKSIHWLFEANKYAL